MTAGCAGVPSSSEPVAVRHVDPSDVGGDNPPDVQFVPDGPSPHMSTRDIVDGFLRASSAEQDAGHQVARRFLTPSAAATWKDTAQATIYTTPLVDDAGNGDVKVTTTQYATIAQDGSYHTNNATAIVHFRLAKVKGEWRIDNPPPGIYVTRQDFQQNFHPVNVYFLNPSHTALVPDPRYFEVPNSAMANRLMQALLAGPSQWLQPAVVTDVPPKTQLRNPVVDDSPTLTVDLDGLGSLGKAQLKGLSAQIVYTLTKYTGSQVRILSEGQPLAVPGEQTNQQQADWQSYDAEVLPASAQLYVVRAGAVWTGDGKRVPDAAGKGWYALNSVAVSLDGSKMAGVSHRQPKDELFVGPTGKPLNKRFSAHSLTPPTWGGQSGEVWTVRDGTDVISVPADGDGQAVKIPAPTVSKYAPIQELRLSRDGTRVALIGRGGRLYVGRVSRNADNTTIDGLHQLAVGHLGFTTVSWADGDEVIGLAPNSSSSVVPWEIAIDGSSTQSDDIDTLPASPNAVAAAANQLTTVVAKNELWYYERTTWARTTSPGGQPIFGASLAYPD
jgi:hypothetical protein